VREEQTEMKNRKSVDIIPETINWRPTNSELTRIILF
jgi:hypothetical protein